MELESCFADRPVFVTGADGFIGSHLTEQLVDFGADVNVFVRATSSGMEISIRELVETIAELTGFENGVECDTSKPDGQPRRRLDTSRANERFGWEATTDFEEGLRKTIEWHETQRS